MSTNQPRSFSPVHSTTSTTSASFQSHLLSQTEQQLSSKLGQLKAHNLVLKRAIIEYKQQVTDLNAQLNAKDATIRANRQTIDSISFHNSNLSKRIHQLQSQFKSNSHNGLTSRISSLGVFSSFRRSSASTESDPLSVNEITATRDLLATTVQELERKIVDTEALQSELNEIKSKQDLDQSGIILERDEALNKLANFQLEVRDLQLQIEDRDRMAEELKRVMEQVARLQNELKLRDTQIRADQNEKSEFQAALNAYLVKFTSSSEFGTLTAESVLNNLQSFIDQTVHSLLYAFGNELSLSLPWSKAENNVVLSKLSSTALKIPYSYSSTTPSSRKRHILALIDSYTDLVPPNDPDAPVCSTLKQGVMNEQWDPNCILAFLRILFKLAEPQPNREIRESFIQAMNRLKDLAHLIETYDQASHIRDRAPTVSSMALLDLILSTVVSIGNVHCQILNQSREEKARTCSAFTQVQSIDLVSITHTSTQTNSACRKTCETQTSTQTALKSSQTDTMAGVGLFTSIEPSSVENGTSERLNQVESVSIPSPAIEDEMRTLRQYYVSQVAEYTSIAQTASQRAFQLEHEYQKSVAALTSANDAQTKLFSIERVDLQLKIDSADTQLQLLHAQLVDMQDKARDMENSYLNQLQVLTEEVCRLQEQTSLSNQTTSLL